jgi:Holliday junction DNA helicase RuvA
MIAYIKGTLTHKSPTEVLIETAAGIGYRVHITLTTFNQLQALNTITLLTHFVVKEDSQTLYGFVNEAERSMFTALISVSGVGPNTARILLSTLTADQLRSAIIAEDVAVLKGAKGIGPKSAKRIILELKDKLLKDSGAQSLAIAGTLSTIATENPVREEAMAALLALGFNKNMVQKALNRVLKAQPTITDAGELIKLGLNALT